MVRGTLAAALTPLRDDGAALDEDALGPYLDFLAAGGLDGILALGTTGAAGVAVIGPPYYPLDEDALLAHFTAAARAAEPLPFYVYEFEARSGYAVPVRVIERLRQEVSNLAGLKVSDRPLEAVEPYLLEGLDVFVGAEEPLPVAGSAGT